MSFLIKIREASGSECVINKKTSSKTWKEDFLTVFKTLSENEDYTIDLHPEQQTMDILRSEQLTKRGYLYNTKQTVKQVVYHVSLIKFEIFEPVSTNEIAVQTETKTTSTFSGQIGDRVEKMDNTTNTETEAVDEKQVGTENDLYWNQYDHVDSEDYFGTYYETRVQPEHRFYEHTQNEFEEIDLSDNNNCTDFFSKDSFTKIYNSAYEKRQAENYLYTPLPDSYQTGPIPFDDTCPLIDIRIDPIDTAPSAPAGCFNDDLIDELKSKLIKPNYGLNYRNGYSYFG